MPRLLEELGCCVDGAENGQVAINMLKENQYDLIIMDLLMTDKDGYITTEEIRSGIVPHQKNIAILAHTSESANVAKIKTQKVGMDGFVGKPCTQLDLIKAVHHAMECAIRRNSFDKSGNHLKGKTILIADDELINRQYLEIYTKEWGMHALQAADGQAVLNILEQAPHIDIVFMDMEMPIMNGVETTQHIRANPKHNDLIIIALTGNFSEQSAQEAMASGMNDFITKPFNQNVLKQKLMQLITARDLMSSASTVAQNRLSVSYRIGIERIVTNPDEIVVHQRQEESATIDAEINALTNSVTNRYCPEYQRQEAFFKDMPLIDYAQLTNFESSFGDRFHDFLHRFLANLLARSADLQNSFNNKDMHAMLMALHSLVGVTGYVGAHALQQYIKLRLYSPVHAGYLPDEEAWVETVDALVRDTVDVLRARHP